jgi:formylglycine-generating enzyme required for sulfatase activity
MGSPAGEEGRDADEGPQRTVTISRAFAVGKFEVTRGQYQAFAAATGRGDGNGCYGLTGTEWKLDAGRKWRNPGFSQTDQHPVVCVDWEDAQAYVQWLSNRTGKRYRLLSEAEWEYVARAGTTSRFNWGNDPSGGCGVANGADRSAQRQLPSTWTYSTCDDGTVFTAAVGRYAANKFGLHHIIGNVWEWTEDCYNESYAGAPSDGSAWRSGDCSRRVLRGGSWFSNPRLLRSASRFRLYPSIRSYYDGFRVARTL